MLGTRDGRLRERTSRSASRNGSPMPPRSDGKVSAVDEPSVAERKKKTFMDRWVEPPLSEKPSYQDHGGSPYGPLEHMQALGEAPSAKVKSRIRPDGLRKSAAARSAAGFGLDAQETPEGTPDPSFSASQHHLDIPIGTAVVIEDEGDSDFAPNAAKKKKTKKSSAQTKPAKRKSESNGHTAPSITMQEPEAQTQEDWLRFYTVQKLQGVVLAAMQRAEDMGQPELACAVEEINLQSRTNERLTRLLESILLQEAQDDDVAEFQGYVREAKRKLKAKQAALDKPLEGELKKVRKSRESRETLEAEAAKRGSQMPAVRSPTAQTGPSHPLSTIPSMKPFDNTKPRLSIKLRSSPQTLNRRISPIASESSPPPTQRPLSTSLKRKRSGSMNSDSSLTSMTSNEDNVGAAENAASGASSGVATALNGTKGKTTSKRSSLMAPKPGVKRSSTEAGLPDEAERDRALAAKKQKLSEKLVRESSVKESYIRQSLDTPSRRRTRAQKPGHAAISHSESPLSSPGPSRRGSPDPKKRTAQTFGRKAKVKQSPEKKHPASGHRGLTLGGGAERESPIGDDDNDELSDNNDFCSACGGSGYLVCCDGCDRSFHFTCLDPPLNDGASELNEPWYCYICVAKRPVTTERLDKPSRGLFAPLLNNLRRRNPTNFSLPQEIRDYFEGTATDKNGAFVEAVHTRTRNRAGYDELPDYTKIKDAKGSTVLCYSCSKSSQDSRPIIQCDYCKENWHLDCLDPPLSNPPARNLEGRKVHDWMCPLHVDLELRKLDTSLLYSRRRIHLRKPRNHKVVETALPRGFVNNGVIEVVDDDDDQSDSEFYDDESQDEAVVYRLPSSGIKLDFIDKVKSTRLQFISGEPPRKKTRIDAPTPKQLAQANFARRSFREQQMALNLAQLASIQQNVNLGNDQVENLVGTLIAEAPREVVDEMMQAEDAENVRSTSSAIPPSPPSSEQTDQLSATQRKQLQLLQELIQRRLESSKP